MRWTERDWWMVGVWLAVSLCAVAHGQAPVTTVQDTVHRADGQPAAGTVTVSWQAFTTADGTAIQAGSTALTLGTGGSLSVNLAPNAAATPMGSYYTAVFHLSDGTVSREFWVVPATVPGGGAAKLAGIRNQVLPSSMAMQTVSKAYVDATVAKAMVGVAPVSSPFVLKAGDTLAGPLVLPADPASANQAATKHYVDANFATAMNGTIAATRLPVFGASGTGHATGAVPDPGATAGTTRFLREDGSWVSAGDGVAGSAGGDLSGAYPNLTVSAVHATAGTLDGVAVGQTDPSAGSFTNVNAQSASVTGSGGTGNMLTVRSTDAASYSLFRFTTSDGANFDFGKNGPSNQGGSVYFFTTAAVPITFMNANALRMQITAGGDVEFGSNAQMVITTAGGVRGLATAPTGSCAESGTWVFSQDGHASFCDAGMWIAKI